MSSKCISMPNAPINYWIKAQLSSIPVWGGLAMRIWVNNNANNMDGCLNVEFCPLMPCNYFSNDYVKYSLQFNGTPSCTSQTVIKILTRQYVDFHVTNSFANHLNSESRTSSILVLPGYAHAQGFHNAWTTNSLSTSIHLFATSNLLVWGNLVILQRRSIKISVFYKFLIV